jgi:hypothetical protein
MRLYEFINLWGGGASIFYAFFSRPRTRRELKRVPPNIKRVLDSPEKSAVDKKGDEMKSLLPNKTVKSSFNDEKGTWRGDEETKRTENKTIKSLLSLLMTIKGNTNDDNPPSEDKVNIAKSFLPRHQRIR